MAGGEGRALVALGGNLPGADGTAPQVLLAQALARLAQRAPLRAVSRFWRTPAFPAGAGPDYVNACAALAWGGDADDLLAILHGIEADLGRDRDGVARWSARVIDLDLIALGDAIRPDPATEAEWRGLPPDRRGAVAPDHLILPHPRLAERGFVLVPLAEVAPAWRHPATGRSVAQMLADLPAAERAEITPI